MPSQQVLKNKDGAVYTTSNGAAVSQPYAAQKLGPVGPLLLQGAYSLRFFTMENSGSIFGIRFPPH